MHIANCHRTNALAAGVLALSFTSDVKVSRHSEEETTIFQTNAGFRQALTTGIAVCKAMEVSWPKWNIVAKNSY